jgi:hypothetical protein
LTLMVCALDQARMGTAGAFASREAAAAAVAESARKGYVDGRALEGVFAWLRPNDLIWNYFVNNYLLGKEPPAFDILSPRRADRAQPRWPPGIASDHSVALGIDARQPHPRPGSDKPLRSRGATSSSAYIPHPGPRRING